MAASLPHQRSPEPASMCGLSAEQHEMIERWTSPSSRAQVGASAPHARNGLPRAATPSPSTTATTAIQRQKLSRKSLRRGRAVAIQADVTDHADVERLFAVAR